jgi:hypothetical protein
MVRGAFGVDLLVGSMGEHLIHLTGGGDNEIAAVITQDREGDVCQVTLRYRDELFEAKASDFFEAFCKIRLQLEPKGLIPFCYGASLDVYPSGICRSMGTGMKAYRITHGRHALLTDLVSIFDSGSDVIPSSVANQKENFQAWLQSLRPKDPSTQAATGP